jgi:Zn-dependent protease with chaperone function
MTRYRYPGEQTILWLTLAVVFIITIVTAAPTICISPLIFALFIALAYWLNLAHHREIVKSAHAITHQTSPELFELAKDCANRLRPAPFELFVLRSGERNAYTFGLSNPRVVVLYSSLLKIMDPTELRFILGHELGHIALSHTWLNTLLGGMAGVPPSFGAAIVFTFAFRWWNRACEYSADRAGLLACGSLEKATSALVKLVAGGLRSQAEMDHAMAVVDAEDDSLLNNLAETLSTHPLVINRIEKLREYAISREYQSLLAQISKT